MIRFEILLQLSHQNVELTYKERVLTFSPPHTKTSGYCHHQRQFSNRGKHYHCRSNLYRFNACNDIYHSIQGMILHKVNTKRWFHSRCHRDLWMFPFSFWFLFYFLCTCLYDLPLANLLGTFDAYISLQAMSVDKLTMCASHCNFLMGCNA
jgi:hypothetical protein